jgi:hypothetical protein
MIPVYSGAPNQIYRSSLPNNTGSENDLVINPSLLKSMVRLADIIESISSDPLLYGTLSIEQLLQFLRLSLRLAPEIQLSAPRSIGTLPLHLPENIKNFLSATLDLDQSLVDKLWIACRCYISSIKGMAHNDWESRSMTGRSLAELGRAQQMGANFIKQRPDLHILTLINTRHSMYCPSYSCLYPAWMWS